MTTENQQYKHQASTLGYGDIVLYNQNGKICNAQVLQSQIVQVPDRGAPGGMRNEEHLTLIFLTPAAGKQVMSQIEMDQAISKAFGIQEWNEQNKVGWMRATVTFAGEAPPGLTTEQEAQYAGHPHSG